MSLFLKIFLWFWGAMAILGLSLVAVQITSHDDPVISLRSGMMADLPTYGAIAVRKYEESGDAELQKYLRRIEERAHVRAYLFDPMGKECGDTRRAPADLRDLVYKTSTLSVQEGDLSAKFDFSTLNGLVAQPVRSERGTYIFAGAVSRTLLAATRDEPQTHVLRVASVFLITGLFCYGLARYLAAPVGRIRHAAQRITSGDLTARVEPNRFPRGRDELTGLAIDFDAMAERMENLVAAQSRLLGDVSHELRSPLTRLNLALELARRGDEAKRAAAFERIEREAARLDALIGELLALSRLENGLRAENLQKIVDLSALAREVAADADFEAQNAGRGVRVTFSGPDTTVSVRGDAELLRRALENVARNAARHTDANSEVEISLAPVKNGKDGWVLRVRDHGPGVPEGELDAIFRPFYRVEGARERAEFDRGTGLGLAIAERATHAHGGKIGAKNAQGGGLEVEIWLPAPK
ncbi:MAG: HAMP domain-containing protein [Armatimonadetes bacterium]|nr:HAMP domain-containing protein [Armatimonadota bacterium]